jgi:hypothetical protein
MCIIAKACNYKALRQIKSRPQEGAIDLNVRLLKVKVDDMNDCLSFITTTFPSQYENIQFSCLH